MWFMCDTMCDIDAKNDRTYNLHRFGSISFAIARYVRRILILRYLLQWVRLWACLYFISLLLEHDMAKGHNSQTIKISLINKSHIEYTCEYKKVPKMAIAAPSALTGWTGVWKIMIEETITEIRFMVFPMLNVSGEISSRDMYDTWLYRW